MEQHTSKDGIASLSDTMHLLEIDTGLWHIHTLLGHNSRIIEVYTYASQKSS
ncbi:MAG: hypothetical protein REI64_05430 [Pedobacter sp.]|uniref:hypothetical protein n=1 Tax=Pedobacter sp. TaxID=1411316 RepID=UPI002807CA7C|nr:hypothetical protein [Pedobacter sp.]MDQ8004221.1 hypothetical protein [Pedobacter sp.]